MRIILTHFCFPAQARAIYETLLLWYHTECDQVMSHVHSDGTYIIL